MSIKTILSPVGRPAAGLALLRIVLGVIFAAHGAQKLFVFGLAGVTGAFTEMGAPLPAISGPLVSFIELGGGIALALGLFSRISSILLAGVMLGAMFLVHLPNGFFLPSGIEFVLALFSGAAAIAISGPGALSLDGVLFGQKGLALETKSARGAVSGASKAA